MKRERPAPSVGFVPGGIARVGAFVTLTESFAKGGVRRLLASLLCTIGSLGAVSVLASAPACERSSISATVGEFNIL
eukprot:13384158-Alexandrium_andersonii.AAC.1